MSKSAIPVVRSDAQALAELNKGYQQMSRRLIDMENRRDAQDHAARLIEVIEQQTRVGLATLQDLNRIISGRTLDAGENDLVTSMLRIMESDDDEILWGWLGLLPEQAIRILGYSTPRIVTAERDSD